MEGTQSSKFDKAYPGCLGRMVNLFETDNGASTNHFLPDKQQANGFTVSRSRSDISSMSPCVNQIEDKLMVSECKRASTHQYNGVPMKMLIAQEMSKEVMNSGNTSPNLIAKLMGLDSLPHQQHGSVNQRNLLCHNRCHSEISISNWEQKNAILNYVEPHECKDVREVCTKSMKPNNKDRSSEIAKQRQMAFVRQKFIEAKRMSMEEKLRQSKQFQDALEVLNSNKELFLKCLHEPNAVLSQQHRNMPSVPPPLETKRVTVLRPSKFAESNLVATAAEHGKQVSKGTFAQLNCFETGGNSPPPPPPGWKNHGSPAQPTRIVVLKPSSGKIHGDSAVGFPQSESSVIHGEHLPGSAGDNENKKSKADAKARTEQMLQNLDRHCGNEILIPSAFPNGYVADESSFRKSDCEFPSGNLRDSEFMSPALRHSWDHGNRPGSPYSPCSYSRTSHSPESSVCREAKKRLSERWSMMTSNGSFQDRRLVQNNASTLGEMLALSETKKAATPPESTDLKSLFVSESRPDDYLDCSSPPCEIKFSTDSRVSVEDKPNSSEESATLSGGTSSLRGKVSSLSLSRNKMASEDKTPAVEVSTDGTGSCVETRQDHPVPALWRQIRSLASYETVSNPDMISPEPGVSEPRPITTGSPSKNQDMQSPVSVLDMPFEKNEHTGRIPGYLKLERRGADLPPSSISSNLIDKSPPIGSIARASSRNDSGPEKASTSPVKDSKGRDEAIEEWSLSLNTLLSLAGLQGELPSNLVFSRWYSPEIPLDPSLRDKYLDLDTKHEAERRQKRSMQKLAFDCVNAALVDIASASADAQQLLNISDNVIAWVNSLISNEICCNFEVEDFVEKAVIKEVVRNDEWNEKLRVEMHCLGIKIGGKLMEELVEETALQLTGT